MKNILQFFSGLIGGSDRFRSNFLKIASANALAQIIGVASLPVLSRLYSPEDFGVLATYTLMQSIILSFITGRIEWIIPNAKSRSQASRLFGLGLAILALIMCVISFVLLIFNEPLMVILKLQENSLLLWLLPVGIIAGAFQLLLQSYYVFGGNLGQVGYSKLAQALITMALSLLLGFVALIGNGLVLAYIAGFIGAVVVLLLGGGAGILKTSTINFRRLMRLFRIYFRQIMASTMLSIVNISMTMSITMLLILFYSSQIVGWYGLVFRIATAPIGLFTAAIAQSFWTDAAILAKTDPKALRIFYISSVKRLSLLALPFAVVFLLAPFYIPFIFGAKEWSGAGHLLMAVTPYLVGMIIFSPTTHLIVYGKAHWQLVCDLLTFVIAVIGFAMVANLGQEAWVAIAVTSIILLAGYLLRFVVHLHANSLQIKNILIKVSVKR